jgi:large subunit ribosomal protein L29
MAQLTDEQLVHRMLQVERDLVAARFRHSMNQLENTASLGGLRKEIARLKTEARQREVANGLPKNALFDQHAKTFGASKAASSDAAAEKGGFLSGIVDKLTGND